MTGPPSPHSRHASPRDSTSHRHKVATHIYTHKGHSRPKLALQTQPLCPPPTAFPQTLLCVCAPLRPGPDGADAVSGGHAADWCHWARWRQALRRRTPQNRCAKRRTTPPTNLAVFPCPHPSLCVCGLCRGEPVCACPARDVSGRAPLHGRRAGQHHQGPRGMTLHIHLGPQEGTHGTGGARGTWLSRAGGEERVNVG